MKLSANFHLSEFTTSATAARLGIPIHPTPDDVENLRRLCSLVLQPLRDEVGVLHVLSGLRPTKLNRVVGGALDSQHITGQAGDVFSETYSPLDLARLVYELGLAFDQLIVASSYMHVSASLEPRGVVLTKTPDGGYLRGLHNVW